MAVHLETSDVLQRMQLALAIKRSSDKLYWISDSLVNDPADPGELLAGLLFLAQVRRALFLDVIQGAEIAHVLFAILDLRQAHDQKQAELGSGRGFVLAHWAAAKVRVKNSRRFISLAGWGFRRISSCS